MDGGDGDARWWRGPLDVESLAMDAVAALRQAVARVADGDVTTTRELIAASFAAVERLRIDGRSVDPWAPMSGFVRAEDGWVRLHANYPHHAAAITAALGVSARDDLVAAVAARPAQDVEDDVVAAGGVATVVRTVEEWAAHPHGVATAGQDLEGVTHTAARPARRATPSSRPLMGIRVLDLTRVIAGPTCSQVLASLGADVLRIDPPGRPELLDAYLSNGMGKRSALVDLNRDAATVRALAAEADVVLIGYRPGSLDRFGLSPSALVDDHPHLVVGSLSAWGEIGPWAHRAGFDSIVQAATGIATIYAAPDGRPGALPVQALDHTSGLHLAADVLDLLADGFGGLIRASLLQRAGTLLDRRQPHDDAEGLDLPTVELDTPHGHISTVPPPVLVAGRMLTAPITEYGAAEPAWLVSS